MTLRLGDGADGKTETLGGGPFDVDPSSLGAKGNLFIAQRRHELTLLGTATTLIAQPVLTQPDPAGEAPGTGAGGGGEGGDGPGGEGGADGGDG